MSVKEITFLDYLDEEIEKEPKELQAALKEVVGHIVIKMALSRRNFIPIFWEMQEIPEELFYPVLWTYHRAKARLKEVKI